MKLLIIDDNFLSDDPSIITLKKRFSQLEVSIYKTGEAFLCILEKNPTIIFQSIIILDLAFGSGAMQGIDILRKIRKISSLIPVIIFTGADEPSQLIPDFINLDTNAYLTKTASIEDIVDKVRMCIEILQNNVAAALTEWIEAHPISEKSDSCIFNVEGKGYSLSQIAEELKQNSFAGKKFVNSLLRLTIDLISRNKEAL